MLIQLLHQSYGNIRDIGKLKHVGLERICLMESTGQ